MTTVLSALTSLGSKAAFRSRGFYGVGPNASSPLPKVILSGYKVF